MKLPDLLADLSGAGVVLSAAGDQLHIDAPRGAITPDLLASLQAHKAELLDLLRKRDARPDDAEGIWKAALAELRGDPLWPDELLAELRAAAVRWGGCPITDRTESTLTNATAGECTENRPAVSMR